MSERRPNSLGIAAGAIVFFADPLRAWATRNTAAPAS